MQQEFGKSLCNISVKMTERSINKVFEQTRDWLLSQLCSDYYGCGGSTKIEEWQCKFF